MPLAVANLKPATMNVHDGGPDMQQLLREQAEEATFLQLISGAQVIAPASQTVFSWGASFIARTIYEEVPIFCSLHRAVLVG